MRVLSPLSFKPLRFRGGLLYHRNRRRVMKEIIMCRGVQSPLFPPTEASLVRTSPSPAWGGQFLVPKSHNAQRYYYCGAPLAVTSGVRAALTWWLGFGRSSQKYRGHLITSDSHIDRVSSLESRPVCTPTHPMIIQYWGRGSSCAKWGSAP